MISKLGFAAAAVALLAAGCADEAPLERQWTKTNATPEDVKRDLYWCTTQERERSKAQEGPVEERRVFIKVNDACMEQRGYNKVVPQK
jgi:hypothetical protein